MSNQASSSRVKPTGLSRRVINDTPRTSGEVDAGNARPDANLSEENNNGGVEAELDLAATLAQLRVERTEAHARLDYLYQMKERGAWLSVTPNCPIGHEPLDDPWQTPRGHIFCFVCIWTWLSDHDGCPSCRRQVRREDLVECGTSNSDPFGTTQPQPHNNTQSALAHLPSRQTRTGLGLLMYSPPGTSSAENGQTADSGTQTSNAATVPEEYVELYTILDEIGRYWAVSRMTERTSN